MGAKLTDEEIKKRILEKCPGVNLDDYFNINLYTNIKLVCKEHGEYFKKARFILYKNHRCPICTQLEKNKKLSEIGKTKIGKLNSFYGKHHTKESMQKKKETCLKKYGVDYPAQCEEIKQKISDTVKSKECQDQTKQTLFEKYGDINYNNREKAKKTSIDRYGVEHYAKTDEFSTLMYSTWAIRNKEEKKSIVKKSKTTKLNRYGKENYNNREQAKETCLKKYGKSSLYTYGSQEFEENMIEKYGEDYKKNISKKARNTHNKIIEKFEKENNCTLRVKLIKKYGQGWEQLLDDLKTLKRGNNVFILNSEIPKIEEYYNTPHNQGGYSEKEKDLVTWVKSIYGGKIIENVRNIIFPQELDLYIPDKNLAIEYNGSYWHSNLNKAKEYHFKKSKACEEKGIRLIHIYEWEWPSDKIKSLLKIALGRVDNKIYARNCNIKEITNVDARDFNSINHLQGHRNAQVTYGLFYKDELVQLMSFSRTRYNRNIKNDNEWEIMRGCPGSNNIVIGGVEKLFKHFIKKYNPEKVFSYCDFNKFDGNSYEKIGMKFTGYTGPDKTWIIEGQPVKRNPTRYKELKAKAEYIIWGSGSKKYEWRKII